MSATEANTLSFQEKLGIPIMSIEGGKTLLKEYILNTMNLWEQGKEVEKQTFHFIGAAGIGKTQICYQVANELTEITGKKFDAIGINCPFFSRDDFMIPFPVVDTVEGMKEALFKMLYSDFVPRDKDSYGIFVIDEFARGDKQLQQLLWQVQNEYKMHTYRFPKGWFVVSLDNPDEEAYEMDYMDDAAGLRRMAHFYLETNAVDFLNNAMKHKYHPAIIQFIQATPDALYDFQGQKHGRVYANPASYEKLSNVLWGYEAGDGIYKNKNKVELHAGSLLNMAKAKLFMDFLNGIKIIRPNDIFNKYEEIRPEILEYMKNGDNAQLGKTLIAYITYLTTSMPKYTSKEIENTARFLLDIPIDTATLFYSEVYKLPHGSGGVCEAYKYMTNMQKELVKIPDFKGIWTHLGNISKGVQSQK